MNFHVNHRLLFFTAFGGFVLLTGVIAIMPAFTSMAFAPTPGLDPLTPEQQRGREIYVAEGCSYCHTQQLRPLPQDRPYGRPAAAGDYYYQTPQLLGTGRTGPDLSDIGARQPDDIWHLVHLYNPRAVVKESVMPAYWWYFQVKDRREPGDRVVPVPPAFAPPGKVVVAGRDALALLAYLHSLQQPKLDMTAFGEAPPAPPPAPAAPAPVATQPATTTAPAQPPAPAAPPVAAAAPAVDTAALRALGEQVYGAQCNRCHGVDGMGTPDLYPPLKGSKTVADADFTQQIRNILNGRVGVPIDGKTYFGAMPAFSELLSDEEIAAVIYFERTSWGNQATVFPTAADVKRLRDEQ